MALRYNGTLIALAREDTGETDYGTDNGVPQSVAIQAMTEAVIHCQNVLYENWPRYFDILTYLSGVAGQLEYTLPDNTFLGSAIASVEYSSDGSANNYYPLDYRDYIYRTGERSNEPRRYIPYGINKFILDPYLDTSVGSLRVAHAVALDAPALRAGRIASSTNNGTAYQTIVLESGTEADEADFDADEYVCVNDRDGNVTYYNVPYTAYDSGTLTLTLDTTGSLMSDGTITDGSYITIGKYSTTHIKLDRVAEPIVLSYLRRRFYLTKSSDDVSAENENISAFTAEMVRVYNRTVRSQKKVPYTGKFELT